MEKIKFRNNDAIFYINSIHRIKDGVLKLEFEAENIPDEKTILSGFNLINEYNDKIMDNGEYLLYTCKYKDPEGNEYFISTGEIYVKEEPSETIVPVEKELTEEEKVNQRKQAFLVAKGDKINEMRHSCDVNINNGVFVNGEQFSFTTEDQNNIKIAMELAQKTGLDVPYHANSESCALYSYKQLSDIFMQGQLNIIRNQTYFNQLKLYITSITDENMIDTVKAIIYGDQLTGEYLDKYNEIMEQTNLIMNKYSEINLKTDADTQVAE